MRLVQGIDKRQPDLPETQFKLGEHGVAEGFGGDTCSIGDKENGAIGGGRQVGWQFGHDKFEYKAIKAAILEAKCVTPCKMLHISGTTSHCIEKNNKKRKTAKAHMQISYHQTRGCYVQRSTFRGYPGGYVRSFL
jgi:hypothetical protein